MLILKRTLAIVLMIGLSIYFVRAFDSRTMKPLYAEHRLELSAEYQAGTEIDWAGYIALEHRLSDDLNRALADRIPPYKSLNRHSTNGANNAETYKINFNRSYALQPANQVGSAVLIHGLTDSPYSVRSTAELFQQLGFHTYAPRLPGHGFAVGALRHADWQDWMDIVKMAMREAHQKRQPGQPLVLGGYSNGGILSLKYAIDCQTEPDMPCPDAILLLSPAIKVSPFAIFAKLHTLVSWLDYFEQFQWESIYPEIDPYKYTSFPKNPGWETGELSSHINEVIETGGLNLPPILAFQSVVDSTVNAGALVNLFNNLDANQHYLVLYDTNRSDNISEWIEVELKNFVDLEEEAPYDYSISVLSNTSPDSSAVQEKRLPEGSKHFEAISTNLSWPEDIYSLSHIALPFPPEDPVYGQDGFAVGARALKGEKKVMRLNPDYFLRLRYNPFYKWQENKISSWLQSHTDKTVAIPLLQHEVSLMGHELQAFESEGGQGTDK